MCLFIAPYYQVIVIKNERSGYIYKNGNGIDRTVSFYPLQLTVYPQVSIMNYSNQEIKLANEIAAALDDRESIQMHLQYTARYQESFLRRILTKVMSIPEQNIRRTRGALYTFLVNQHGGNNKTGH